MSTPAPAGSGASEDRQGLSKFMRRASKVFRKDKSKRQSVSGTSALTPVKDTGAPTTGQPTAASTSAKATAPAAVAAATTTGETKPSSTPIKPKVAKTAAENSKLQEDKARAIFAKYNMTLEPGEWSSPVRGDAVRVEKKVRMRIHRTCHRCQTSFGPEKLCIYCQHRRCKKCPVDPGTRPMAAKEKSAMAMAGQPGTAGKGATDDPATKPLRRICHKCGKVSPSTPTDCHSCGHEHCIQCPEALPGDTDDPSKPIRTPWTCHGCKKRFRTLENYCSDCGHKRCNDCPLDTTPEPSAAQRVQDRLKGLDVSPQASAA